MNQRLSACALALLLAVPVTVAAQAANRPLLKEYIGNADTDALLKEPEVRAPLEAMVGKQMPQLLRSLNVRGDEIRAVDALTGSFVLEWNPALALDGKPYAKYVISSMCKYQGVPGGGSFTGANGGQIEWTGPPFKVRATCSCLGKTPTWPVLTQMPNPYAFRSAAVYADWFQLPCLQPARGPL